MFDEYLKVGDVDVSGQRLVEITKESLQVGLDQCGPGKPFSGIFTHKLIFQFESIIEIVFAFRFQSFPNLYKQNYLLFLFRNWKCN